MSTIVGCIWQLDYTEEVADGRKVYSLQHTCMCSTYHKRYVIKEMRGNAAINQDKKQKRKEIKIRGIIYIYILKAHTAFIVGPSSPVVSETTVVEQARQ